MKMKERLMTGLVTVGILVIAVVMLSSISSRTGLSISANAATDSSEINVVSDNQMAAELPISESSEVMLSQADVGDVIELKTPDSAASKDFYADIKVGSSWGESVVYKQLDINVINKTTKYIAQGWTLKIRVGNNAAIDTGWSGTYSISDGILTIKPADYNSVIAPGESAGIGVIIYNADGDLAYALVADNVGIAGESSTGTTSDTSTSTGTSTGTTGTTTGGTVAPVENGTALPVPEPTTDDWLYVVGTDIVDSTGKKVWLTGVNWFGYNTGTNTFDGLWNSDLNASIKAIANHGFNLIRVPISAELILEWKAGKAPTANFNQATNSYLVGMDSLQIFDYVIGQCRANGLKIMIDIHSAETNASGHTINLWKTSKITTEQYQEALVWMAGRYKNDDTIIAYDLKNEPHGKPYEGSEAAIWNNSKSDNNWKYVAEQTALKVLTANPNVLIMVEGTEIYPIDIKSNGDFKSTNDKDYYFNWWGGNLRGVADYPINLGKYQNKLVYSPHDYGPTVYEQPWFKGTYTYDSLMKDCWKDNWFYIYEKGTAPLLIGEWGGYMTAPNITWMTYMRQLISTYHLNHTFWCFNANSGDTGGLVLDDFTTWDEEKYAFVKEVLWQENGKFVGLDHKIALGTAGNGITLTEAKGLK